MMSDPIAILRAEREKIVEARAQACIVFDARINEYDAAIAAIERVRDHCGPSGLKVEATVIRRDAPAGMTRDAAIIEAIKNGKRQPAAILDFMSRHLGVETTINSVRTRLSRMKSSGEIQHDKRGWIMPHEVSEGPPLNENEGDAAPSEADAGGAGSTSGGPKPQLSRHGA